MLSLRVNGKTYQVDAEPATPLLWVLRDNIGLTGTKYGCGIAQCGACTVHVDGRATRSCVPLSAPCSPTTSSRLRVCRQTASIRSSAPGSSTMCRSVAIASLARSWRWRPCWHAPETPLKATSIGKSRIFAGVAPTNGFEPRSAGPPNWPKLNTGATEEVTPWPSITR